MAEIGPIAAREANPGLPAGEQGREERRLRQACQDLEGVFMRYVVREMKLISRQQGVSPGTAGAEQYGTLIEETMAKALTEAGGVGIADLLYRQLREAVLGAAEEIRGQTLKNSLSPSITGAGQSLSASSGQEETG